MVKSGQSISRALDIIESLSKKKEGYGVTELSNIVGLHKSTTYRILISLQDRGYVRKNSDSGKYHLTMRIVQLSSAFLDQVQLRTESHPYLKALAMETKQTVHLGILQGIDITYVEKVMAYNNIRTYAQIGMSIPAYRTGMGKALIAALPPNQREELISRIEFKPLLPNTLTDPDKFRKALTQVSENGYAIDDIENEAGIRCIASVVRDYTGKAIAAVSISGSAEDFEGDALALKIDLLKNTTSGISEALGYFEDDSLRGNQQVY